MRSRILKYKNFVGSVEYSDTDKILFGEVQGMGELISYKGKTIKELEKYFMAGIDEYLEVCKGKYLYMNELELIDDCCFYLHEPINEKEKLQKQNIINNFHKFIQEIRPDYKFKIEAFEIFDVGDDELCALLIIKNKYKIFHIDFLGRNTYRAFFAFKGEELMDDDALLDEKDFKNLIEYFKYYF